MSTDPRPPGEPLVHVVGAGGYIGTRLLDALDEEGIGYAAYDLNIYSPADPRVIAEDAEDVLHALQGELVIYLAGPHEEPRGAHDALKWFETYMHQISDLPESVARRASRMLYTSSMRAVTHETLYARCKRWFERICVERSLPVDVLRFGTVWGDFSVEHPNRACTAMNRALLGEFYTNKENPWRAYTTYIHDAVDAIVGWVTEQLDDVLPNNTPTVENITDTPYPLDGTDIARLQTQTHPLLWLQQSFSNEASAVSAMPWREGDDETGAAALRAYYGLEVGDGMA